MAVMLSISCDCGSESKMRSVCVMFSSKKKKKNHLLLPIRIYFLSFTVH